MSNAFCKWIVLAATIVAVVLFQQLYADEPPRRLYSAVERMTLKHLAAAHADAERFRTARRRIEEMAITPEALGLHDYRAILHAHAEDSTHTGGTRPEMLRDAKKAKVSVIMLSDHFRPPRDFMDSWRGLRDGVLFIPGSETHGFLVYPDDSVMDVMTKSKEEILSAVGKGTGLSFLSHVEERVEHSMADLTGMEVYNRHADAKDDRASLLVLASKLTYPAGVAELKKALRLYPDEVLAAQVDYPTIYMKKWDAESQQRPVVGIAANDCHHNQVFIVKKVDDETVLIGTVVDKDDRMRKVTTKIAPGIAELVKEHSPGDIVVKLDFDPYFRSFRNVSTHVLAPELTEAAIRTALRKGHAYISHDWMCDPQGFLSYVVRGGKRVGIMGDQLEFVRGDTIVVQSPLSCRFRLYQDGRMIETAVGSEHRYAVTQAGVYRFEAWLTLDAEERPWIYSNPLYIR